MSSRTRGANPKVAITLIVMLAASCGGGISEPGVAPTSGSVIPASEDTPAGTDLGAPTLDEPTTDVVTSELPPPVDQTAPDLPTPEHPVVLGPGSIAAQLIGVTFEPTSPQAVTYLGDVALPADSELINAAAMTVDLGIFTYRVGSPNYVLFVASRVPDAPSMYTVRTAIDATISESETFGTDCESNNENEIGIVRATVDLSSDQSRPRVVQAWAASDDGSEITQIEATDVSCLLGPY